MLHNVLGQELGGLAVNFTPHQYQRRAIGHLLDTDRAALWASPGAGKTAIVLSALTVLAAEAGRTLVIAPLRVCQTVWRQEAKKWDEFRHLRFSFLHGPTKDAELRRTDADVWLINPEGVQWLCDTLPPGMSIPFDTLVIDEATKFKNSRAVRSKLLRKHISRCKRRWQLTGTPAPNGYIDLFGQFLILDDGAALGKYITHFRDRYFTQAFNGFDYEIRPGAEKQIEERIAPAVRRMNADDYVDMPALIPDIRYVTLDATSRGRYTAMKQQMLATLGEGEVITAANAAAVYSKLKQMANGAVYDEGGGTHVIHNEKLLAVEELVDELQGEPLLVAYEFKHDLNRLLEKFPGTPWIGGGASTKQVMAAVTLWNSGSLPLLFAHPASAGHGLNLQGSAASHICWVAPIWDLELWEQFIRRVWRQGNTAQHVFNHILIAQNTIDELVLSAVEGKAATQTRLLDSINQELGVIDMMQKLPSGPGPQGETKATTPKGWGAQAAEPARHDRQAAAPQAAAPRALPAGWGAPQAEQPAPEPAMTNGGGGFGAETTGDQREEIRAALQGAGGFSPELAQRARELASDVGVTQGADGSSASDTPLPAQQLGIAPKRTRTKRAETVAPPPNLGGEGYGDGVAALIDLARSANDEGIRLSAALALTGRLPA